MNEYEIVQIQIEVRTWTESTVKHSVTHSEKLARYYKALFGKPACSTCPGKIAGYIQQILKLNSNQYSIMANSKYRIKQINGREQLITNNGTIAGLPIHISNANLTDEIAEALLNSNYARFIEEVTDNPQPATNKKMILKSVPPGTNRTMVDTQATNPELQQLLDSKNKKQIMEMLRAMGVKFDSDAPKNELAALVLSQGNKPPEESKV